MKSWSTWARIIISIGACILLLSWVDWSEVGGTLKRANFYWLVVAFLAMHADRFVMALKWRMLMRGTGSSVSADTAVKAYYVGGFWSQVIPTTFGGDLVRTGWMANEDLRAELTASSIVVERFLGFLALAIVATLGLFFVIVYMKLLLPVISVVTLILFILSIAAVLTIFNQTAHNFTQRLISKLRFRGINHKIEKVRISTLAFKDYPKLLFAFLLLSIFEQSFPIIVAIMLARAFSIDLPLVWAAVGVPLILVAIRLPISVNSFGIQEGAYAFVMSFAGISVSESVIMSLFDRVLLLIAMLPGAYLTISQSRRRSTISTVSESPSNPIGD